MSEEAQAAKPVIEFIDIRFSDCTMRVPAFVVADSRAEYYAAKFDASAGETRDGEYERELAYTLSDKGELLDWLYNNMNWSNLEAGAVQVPGSRRKVDHEEEFGAGDAEATVGYKGELAEEGTSAQRMGIETPLMAWQRDGIPYAVLGELVNHPAAKTPGTFEDNLRLLAAIAKASPQ